MKCFKVLEKIVKPGDMVITLGAGNIWRYSDKYLKYLKKNDGNLVCIK